MLSIDKHKAIEGQTNLSTDKLSMDKQSYRRTKLSTDNAIEDKYSSFLVNMNAISMFNNGIMSS